jgi:UDP-N-acetylmuramoylalanine--D-glutamate ligase
MNQEKNAHQRILILGAGESGVYAAILGSTHGFQTLVSDAGKIAPDRIALLNKFHIPWEEGGHEQAFQYNAHIVIKSPGIPSWTSIIGHYRSQGAEIISEIEWAWRFCPPTATIIGITGSNGKTTTTRLIGHLLKFNGYSVSVGGNIGDSFARLMLEPVKDYYVLELSSFQLEDVPTFKPHIALILNISPDHLDRYEGRVDLYASAKLHIVQNQSAEDHYIFRSDDPYINGTLLNFNGIPNLIPINLQHWDSNGCLDLEGNFFDLSNTVLRGRHNALNTVMAAAAVRKVGLTQEQIQEALPHFVNDPHRLEWVGTWNGVQFINDSKATNVDAVFYALEAQQTQVIWIVGGVDKGNDYAELDDLVKQKVKCIIALGVDNSKIMNHFRPLGIPCIDTKSVASAIDTGILMASEGDTILLSPACASFDLFNNYMDRGDQFRSYVKKIIDQHT